MVWITRPRDTVALVKHHLKRLEELKAAAAYPGGHGKTACQILLQRYEGPILRAVKDLAPAKNPLRWLFAGKQKKLAALNALNYLYDAETLGIGREAEQCLQKFQRENK